MAIKFIIQAREGSNRFPNKCFAIIHGKFVIDRVIDAVKKSKYFNGNNIIFIIPEKDTRLVSYLKNRGHKIIHDTNRDVYSAFVQASDKPDDILVRITADSPMLDGNDFDINIIQVEAGKEYAANEITQFGKACEAFRISALKNNPPECEEENQHVTLALRRNSKNKWIPSLMVDYPESIQWIEEYMEGKI